MKLLLNRSTSALQQIFCKQCNAQYYSTSRHLANQNRRHEQQENSNNCKKTSFLFSTAITGFFGYYFFADKERRYVFAEESKILEEKKISAGEFREGLPLYSMNEVTKHITKESKIWVVYREGVYDITEFVEQHPGGEQILIAAGASVEPFWVLYGIHKNEHVFKILETLRIGNLKKADQVQHVDDVGDPYAKDPLRHVALKPANMKPFNAEVPPALLCETFFTPNELFYVRNHLPVPEVDPQTYELQIEIEGSGRTLSFTLDKLKEFPKVSITATLMCAGNRRTEMTKIKPVKGLSWGPCAIGNATWTGVRLRDLLKEVGVTDDEERLKHVQFEGLDFDVTGTEYGASIPIWKAVDKRGDVILAYEMNGVPLPPDHGYPLRVVVPGVAGARNVKWLGKIIVSEIESGSHWQQNDYKGFSPSIDWDTADFSKSPAIQEMPVISAICRPSEGDIVKVENGCITVKGYAWSGGGQKIVRVDLTVDGGKTWYVANLDVQDTASPPQHWAWTLWSAKIPVDANLKRVGHDICHYNIFLLYKLRKEINSLFPFVEAEIWCKAVDSCYNTQPENFENIWNFRGVLSNAYHKVNITLSQ